MSSIKITGNASGTGTFTLKSADRSENYNEISIPDATGTLQVDEEKLINVYQVQKTDAFSMTGGDYIDVYGFYLTVSPKSIKSRFLITCDAWITGSYWYADVRLVRNDKSLTYPQEIIEGTSLGIATFDSAPQVSDDNSPYQINKNDFISWYMYDMNGGNTHGAMQNANFNIIDSPQTTDLIKYKLQIRGRGINGGGHIGRFNYSIPDRNTTEFDLRKASRMVIWEFSE